MLITPVDRIDAEIKVPSDKSISHRCLLFSALAGSQSRIFNLLESEDVKSTYEALKKIGIRFEGNFNDLKVFPEKVENTEYHIYCGNSGTTARIIMGLMGGIEGEFVLTGDASLSARPMKRVTEPLGRMGVDFSYENREGFLPIRLKGSGNLKSIDFVNEKSSAQVKSAVILAGLKSDGVTRVLEKVKSRDHTERILKHMGADIEVADNCVAVRKSVLSGLNMAVPGDFSSAAFFIALSLVHGNSSIKLKDVSVNPTRTGLLDIIGLMGGSFEVTDKHGEVEPIADISVKTSELHGVEIPPELVPAAIDELPLVALLGAKARGRTVLRNASELRVKESDRIAVLCEGMRKIGVMINELEDGFEVEGVQNIQGGVADSYDDHRMAMLFSLCGLVSEKGVDVRHHSSVGISFPNFFDIVDSFRV